MASIWFALALGYAVLTQQGDPTIYEDNLFWDCASMGNHQCGPNAKAPGEL